MKLTSKEECVYREQSGKPQEREVSPPVSRTTADPGIKTILHMEREMSSQEEVNPSWSVQSPDLTQQQSMNSAKVIYYIWTITHKDKDLMVLKELGWTQKQNKMYILSHISNLK